MAAGLAFGPGQEKKTERRTGPTRGGQLELQTLAIKLMSTCVTRDYNPLSYCHFPS